MPFTAGEERKTLETVRGLYDVLLDHKLERGSPIVALGGGVLGDTVGFAAATYLRGVPFVQCPTTLLAMVDSSVGGKVGVNVPQGKNLIGAFHQPVAVVADPLVLRSLPRARAALRPGRVHQARGDSRRRAVRLDARAHGASCSRSRPDALAELVARNVAIKAAVVMEDEKETGVRAHLNLGHTFGHAIEACGRLRPHPARRGGRARACSPRRRSRRELGVGPRELRGEVEAVVGAAGLPRRAALPDDARLLEAMALDKKVAAGRIRFVLPERIGKVVIRDGVRARGDPRRLGDDSRLRRDRET